MRLINLYTKVNKILFHSFLILTMEGLGWSVFPSADHVPLSLLSLQGYKHSQIYKCATMAAMVFFLAHFYVLPCHLVRFKYRERRSLLKIIYSPFFRLPICTLKTSLQGRNFLVTANMISSCTKTKVVF